MASAPVCVCACACVNVSEFGFILKARVWVLQRRIEGGRNRVGEESEIELHNPVSPALICPVL